MSNAIRAGFRYFAIVFIFGFVLGTIRTLYVAPRTGAFAAVALELPLMLAFAWFTCRRLARTVPATAAARLAMGATAFLLLMAAELALAVIAFGLTPAQHLAGLVTAAGLLGLTGQLVFAAFPLLQLRR